MCEREGGRGRTCERYTTCKHHSGIVSVVSCILLQLKGIRWGVMSMHTVWDSASIWEMNTCVWFSSFVGISGDRTEMHVQLLCREVASSSWIPVADDLLLRTDILIGGKHLVLSQMCHHVRRHSIQSLPWLQNRGKLCNNVHCIDLMLNRHAKQSSLPYFDVLWQSNLSVRVKGIHLLILTLSQLVLKTTRMEVHCWNCFISHLLAIYIPHPPWVACCGNYT